MLYNDYSTTLQGLSIHAAKYGDDFRIIQTTRTDTEPT
jgi:hypothetical protein